MRKRTQAKVKGRKRAKIVVVGFIVLVYRTQECLVSGNGDAFYDDCVLIDRFIQTTMPRET